MPVIEGHSQSVTHSLGSTDSPESVLNQMMLSGETRDWYDALSQVLAHPFLTPTYGKHLPPNPLTLIFPAGVWLAASQRCPLVSLSDF